MRKKTLRTRQEKENLFFITCCVAFLYSVAMHTDLHWHSAENELNTIFHAPLVLCRRCRCFVPSFLLFLLAQFTITLKYDYILLTQLNIICISLFFWSCLNTFIMIIHIALQELLSFCAFWKRIKSVRQKCTAKKFSTNDAFVSSRLLFSLGFIAHLIIPHIFKHTQKLKHQKFTEFFPHQLLQNCSTGHFVGNRIMPAHERLVDDGKAAKHGNAFLRYSLEGSNLTFFS